jgi:dipeptidyl aminopeptidase/acylaminoacyl peptidase
VCSFGRVDVLSFGKRRLIALAAVAVWLLAAEAVVSRAAEEQRAVPLAARDVIGLKYLGASQRELSPDGKWLAYAVTSRLGIQTRETPDQYYLRTGVPEDGLGSDVRVIDLGSRVERNLTEGKGNSWLPVWSPDGRFLAFLSTRDGSECAKLWVWNVRENTLRKVSDTAIRSGYFMEWLPDSERVLVAVAPRAQGGCVAKSGTARHKENELGVGNASAAIVYRSSGLNGDGGSSDPLDEQYKERDLAVIQVRDGTSKILTHGERIGICHLFRDGLRVAFSSPERFERPGSQQLLHSLSMVDIQTGRKVLLGNGLRLDLAGNFSVSPTGKRIAFRTTPSDGLFDIWVIDLNSGRLENLSHFGSPTSAVPISHMHRWYYSTALFWDDAGESLYSITDGAVWKSSVSEQTTRELARITDRMVRQLVGRDASRIATLSGEQGTIVIARDEMKKRDGFYKVDLTTGGVERLLEREECYTCAAGPRGHLATMASNGKSIVFSSEDAAHAGDLWLADSEFRKTEQLTNLNPQLGRYILGEARLIDWLDCDGRLRRGGVILPSGYREGTRYPLVVLVYGGAAGSDSLQKFGGFESGIPYLNVQLFATRGYAVLMPDAPQQLGTPMLDLAKTVLPGVNRMVELGIADPDRIGILGHSYGGYSVLSLLVQTNRFKAAMSLNGMGNLVSLYGEMGKNGVAFGTSAETGQELVGGHPWSHRDLYIENSPFFYLDRVQTPVLLVHGAEDTTFAASLSDELFVALRRLGKVVEYARYDGEDHIFTKEENQRDVCERMLRWFDGYLRSVP